MTENLQDNTIKDAFRQYFLTKMLPQLKVWEEKRKKYLLIFILTICIILLWGAVLIVNFEGELAQFLDAWGWALCLVVLVVCCPLFMYYQRTKEKILPLIINFFGSFSYQYRPMLQTEILKQSKIIKDAELLRSDDAFFGEYQGIKVGIIEYTVQKQSPDLKDKENNKIQSKKKYGIIFSAEMNKLFSGQTIVIEDRGMLNKFTHYKNLKRVSLEDPVFEKKFEVYSDDQIESRYILTTAMIEQILKLKEFFPKIRFSFYKGQVLINIKTKKDYFENNYFFRSLLNKKSIEQIFVQMLSLFSIIQILKLNQKNISKDAHQ